MPRPTKLTETTTAKICSALQAGNTRKASAEFGGISKETFYDWLKQAGTETDTDGAFSDFSDSVTRAEAECEMRNVGMVEKAATGFDSVVTKTTTKTVFKTKKTKLKDGTIVEEPVAMQETSQDVTTTREFDWRAAAWWLERRRPKDYREQKTLDVRNLTDEQIITLLEGEAEG